VPGEDKFEGKGVVYCSTCDAPVFKGKTVVVVGGGNSGLEAVVDLFPYADKIYLLHRSESFRGDPVTQDEVFSNPKVETILNAETTEVLGDRVVEGLKYRDKKTGEEKELKVQGVFVEIGSVPNSEMVKDLVNIDKYGEVVVDHKTQATSQKGIWAAGDITDVLYKQNNISAGDAVKAVLNIYDYLKSLSRPAAKSAIEQNGKN
jgi:alkyl hydroperoxide reductase subunit F